MGGRQSVGRYSAEERKRREPDLGLATTLQILDEPEWRRICHQRDCRRAQRAPENMGLRSNAALPPLPVGRSLPRRPNFTPRRRPGAMPLFRRADRAPENMGLRSNAALPPITVIPVDRRRQEAPSPSGTQLENTQQFHPLDSPHKPRHFHHSGEILGHHRLEPTLEGVSAHCLRPVQARQIALIVPLSRLTKIGLWRRQRQEEIAVLIVACLDLPPLPFRTNRQPTNFCLPIELATHVCQMPLNRTSGI